ncbi:MAG: hypothetical protein ABSG08_18170 [Terriglobales bacterium]|jgi:hypothetical protein
MTHKYGLFVPDVKEPLQTFDGDSMAQDKEYVYIYRLASRAGMPKREQVAAIKLDAGQSVKEIS